MAFLFPLSLVFLDLIFFFAFLLNAFFFTVLSLSPLNVIFLILLSPINALELIVLTAFPITTVSSFEQFLNAFFPITVTGSGKSFSAKREIANTFLVTDDDIIVNDPEGEYSPLVNRLKGQVIKISPNSTQFINPMDINANYSEEDNPLSLKADFILSLCELVVGGKEGLLPVEKTVIDRCVHLIYRKYFANPCPENMPILEDLYNALLQQDEKEAHHVATALEIYVKGSLNLFNHRTNVNVNNRIVCYDIKELGKQMKKLGMLIVQDQVWGRVTANRSSGKSTRYYMDEMHLLLKAPAPGEILPA